METEYIRCMSYEKSVIVFINDTTIVDPYEATEEGQNYIDNIQFKEGQQINVELLQENNDRFQVLFPDIEGEPYGWIMKSDMVIDTERMVFPEVENL